MEGSVLSLDANSAVLVFRDLRYGPVHGWPRTDSVVNFCSYQGKVVVIRIANVFIHSRYFSIYVLTQVLMLVMCPHLLLHCIMW